MIIYIHGFNSNGNSCKVDELKNSLPGIDVKSVSYDSENFDTVEDMINDIKSLIINQPNVVLIGSSLGGYLAQYISKTLNCKSVLLNPVLDVEKSLSKFLGENVNFQSNKSYELTLENIKKLDKYKIGEKDFEDANINVFLNKDDEILDYRVTKKFYEKLNRPVFIFETGGHRFMNLMDVSSHIRKIYNTVN